MKQFRKLWMILLTMVCLTGLFGVTAQAKAITASQVVGTWDGTYDGDWQDSSGQLVYVKRHITMSISSCSSSGAITGIIYLSPISGESYQFTGSYYFTGTVDLSTGAIHTYPNGWKKTISNFNPSYFRGTFNISSGKLTGYRTVDNSTSTFYTFSLKKKDSSSVVRSVTYVALSKTKATLNVGSTLKLKYSITPSDITGAKAKWNSSNSSVAKVNSKGKVTALKAGTATITCKVTYNGTSAKATCKITVKGTKKYTRTGIITNAEDGSVLEKATLTFRKGYNKKSGSTYKKTTTDSAGKYKVKLASGKYTMEVKKSGYITTYYNLNCTKNDTSYETNVSVSKRLSSSQYRIVLTWGSTPADLDAHLTGPDGSGNRFHVYWSNKIAYKSGELLANLDVDDRSSYGPETVTINFTVQSSGTYRYYIHDYSNRFRSSSTALASSGARVTVYKGNKQIRSFRVPNKAGTLWHVFDIVNGVLKVRNTMSYETYPANIS